MVGTTLPLQEDNSHAISVTVSQNSEWGYLVLFLAPLLLGGAFLLYRWLTHHHPRWRRFATSTTEGVIKGAWATAAVFSFAFTIYSYFYLYDLGRGPGAVIPENTEANKQAVVQADKAALAAQGKGKEKVEVLGNLSHDFQLKEGDSLTTCHLFITTQKGDGTALAQLQESLPYVVQLNHQLGKVNDVGGDDSGGGIDWSTNQKDNDDWVDLVPLS